MEANIIVIGHGIYPSAILGSVRMITGIEKNLYSVELHEDDDIDTFENKLKNIVNDLSKMSKIVIFADLLGGSPANSALKIYGKNENIDIYVGVNLPLVISSILTQDVRSSLRDAKETMVDLKEFARSFM